MAQSSLAPSALDGAKRLECVCFSTAMVWYGNTQRTILEKRRSTAALSRNAGLRDLDADPSTADCHNELQPNDLGNHDGTAPRNSAGDLVSVVSHNWLVFRCAQNGLERGARKEHPRSGL